jgi:hypothetical protein
MMYIIRPLCCSSIHNEAMLLARSPPCLHFISPRLERQWIGIVIGFVLVSPEAKQGHVAGENGGFKVSIKAGWMPCHSVRPHSALTFRNGSRSPPRCSVP